MLLVYNIDRIYLLNVSFNLNNITPKNIRITIKTKGRLCLNKLRAKITNYNLNILKSLFLQRTVLAKKTEMPQFS